MSSTVETATEIKPFHVELPEEGLDDLRRRIEATRWPSKELVDDRSQGVQLATLKALADYWASEYDFGRVAERLNALPQFVTEIDGIDVHFIHVRSEHEDALPLIMTHGWPGSVIELLETIEPLTAPDNAEDAFHLVLPSVPGYGFSSEPTELGWWAGRVAQIWPQLMQRLGYTRYVAQGGDVGAAITDAMGRLAPEGLIGIHTNLLVTALGGAPQPTDTDEEKAAAKQGAEFRQTGFGYFLEQATRPQTIGYALLDSPVALAAWMLDHDTDSYYKISGAFVEDKPTGGLTRDHILDNITLYWLTGTGASAARSYWESGQAQAQAAAAGQTPPEASCRGLHAVPGRDLPGPAQLGRAGLPQPHLLPQGRQGRALRRLGAAGDLQPGDPRRLPVGALSVRARTCPSRPAAPATRPEEVVRAPPSRPAPRHAVQSRPGRPDRRPARAIVTRCRARALTLSQFRLPCCRAHTLLAEAPTSRIEAKLNALPSTRPRSTASRSTSSTCARSTTTPCR